MCIYIYIYIYIHGRSLFFWSRVWTQACPMSDVRCPTCPRTGPSSEGATYLTLYILQRGGAVETGCSDLHGVVYYFTIRYDPNLLHPPPTAPPYICIYIYICI